MAITKIDNETIEVTEAPVVRTVKIVELKRRKQFVQAQIDRLQAQKDEIAAQIEEARLVGVE